MAETKNIPNFDVDLLSFVNGQHLELSNVVHTKASLAFQPRTKCNVGYIVAAVIFNERDEVLLIQEAKMSCRKLWYLPAGRVEPRESLQEGVKREVLEEAGLEFKPVTMVTVEVQTGSWYRFTFTGTVTGGKLKTVDQADEESLQAAWFPFHLVVNPQMCNLHLRSHDIIPLVQKTMLYKKSPSPYSASLPLLVHHNSMILRLLVVCVCGETLWYIRYGGSKLLSLPALIVSPYESGLGESAARLVQGELGDHIEGKLCGLLNVEYQTMPEKPDGLCLNVLYLVERHEEHSLPRLKKGAYVWEEMNQSELQTVIRGKLRETGTIVLL